MRILIDIGHPAHVHLFRNFAEEMISKGNDFLFTCRNKEFDIDLLEHYSLPYKTFGKKYNSITGKLWGVLKFGYKEFIEGCKFKPDIFISHGSHYAAHASFLLGKPHISFEDTFNFEQIWLYKPFTQVIFTGNYKHPLKSRKIIEYAGYHELAYLHPNRFTPDPSILKTLGVSQGEKYIIVRFVSWNASHDIGHKGISHKNKINAIKEFSKYAKVFISSESILPIELEKYKLQIKPHQIHDVMAYSSLVFGESATMVSEGVCLGVPGIYLDNKGRYYTQDQEEKHELCFNFTESEEDQKKAIEKGVELLQMRNLHEIYQVKKKKLLENKIDVTAFLVWFIENYPESAKIMKENPDYQYKFK